jgi:hypothetical protein
MTTREAPCLPTTPAYEPLVSKTRCSVCGGGSALLQAFEDEWVCKPTAEKADCARAFLHTWIDAAPPELGKKLALTLLFFLLADQLEITFELVTGPCR